MNSDIKSCTSLQGNEGDFISNVPFIRSPCIYRVTVESINLSQDTAVVRFKDTPPEGMGATVTATCCMQNGLCHFGDLFSDIPKVMALGLYWYSEYHGNFWETNVFLVVVDKEKNTAVSRRNIDCLCAPEHITGLFPVGRARNPGTPPVLH